MQLNLRDTYLKNASVILRSRVKPENLKKLPVSQELFSYEYYIFLEKLERQRETPCLSSPLGKIKKIEFSIFDTN